MSARHPGTYGTTQQKGIRGLAEQFYELSKQANLQSIPIPPNFSLLSNGPNVNAATTFPILDPFLVPDAAGTVNIDLSSTFAHYTKISITSNDTTINFKNLVQNRRTKFTLDITINTATFNSITFVPALENPPTIPTTNGSRFIIEISAFKDSTEEKFYVIGGTLISGGGGGISFPIRYTVTNVVATTGNIILNLNSTGGHYFDIGPITGNIDIDITNPPASGIAQAFRINITQDGTGGHTVTFNDTLLVQPLINENVNGVTLLAGDIYDGSVFNIFTMTSSAGSGGGGDASLWANFPAVNNVNYATFDGINIDRLRFIVDSGAVVSPSDPSIFLDLQANMVFNLADQKQYSWKLNNEFKMVLDETGVNNDTLLTLQTNQADASAIPEFLIFRDDPTPLNGTEFGRISFQGTEATSDGGGSTGNHKYAQIAIQYENVVNNRNASSMIFSTSFDNGAATQFKAFLVLNGSNSNQIGALADLNMTLNKIVDVTSIVGRDDGTPFRIIFDGAEDSDTVIQSNVSDPDRIDYFNNGLNGWLTVYDTTINKVGIGIPSTVDAYLSVTDHVIYFSDMTPPTDAEIVNDQGAVFFDTGTDPPILRIKKKNSVGVVSTVNLETGGGASNLNGLSDVTIDSPNNGDTLVYDSLGGIFKNKVYQGLDGDSFRIFNQSITGQTFNEKSWHDMSITSKFNADTFSIIVGDGNIYWIPMILTLPTSIDGFGVYMIGTASQNRVTIGIYNNKDSPSSSDLQPGILQPQDLIFSFIQTDNMILKFNQFEFTAQNLQPGIYWLAIFVTTNLTGSGNFRAIPHSTLRPILGHGDGNNGNGATFIGPGVGYVAVGEGGNSLPSIASTAANFSKLESGGGASEASDVVPSAFVRFTKYNQ